MSITTKVLPQAELLHRDPEIMGGTPVFVGTRVPVQFMFEHLAAGDSLDVFLDDFDSVTREQAVAVLQQAADMLVAHAYSS